VTTSIAATKTSSLLISAIGRKSPILYYLTHFNHLNKIVATSKANLPPSANTKTNTSVLSDAQSTAVLGLKDLHLKVTRYGMSVLFIKWPTAESARKAAPTPYISAMSRIAHVDLGMRMLGLLVGTI
jgi:hypothetical protein